MQDLHRVGPWRGQQLGTRIDPGQMQWQLDQNARECLPDMTRTVEPHGRQWIVQSLHESHLILTEALQARQGARAWRLQELVAVRTCTQITHQSALHTIGSDRTQQHHGSAARALNGFMQ